MFLGSLGVVITRTIIMKKPETYITPPPWPGLIMNQRRTGFMKRRRRKGRMGTCARQSALDPKTYIPASVCTVNQDACFWSSSLCCKELDAIRRSYLFSLEGTTVRSLGAFRKQTNLPEFVDNIRCVELALGSFQKARTHRGSHYMNVSTSKFWFGHPPLMLRRLAAETVAHDESGS